MLYLITTITKDYISIHNFIKKIVNTGVTPISYKNKYNT